MKAINEFKIIGIAARTTNQNNQSVQDIGKLWGQFYANNLIDKIPNKLSNDIYSIYTDYKSDFTEDYTIIIGMQVDNLDTIPSGLIGRKFPGDNFTVFLAKGEMPKAIMDAWATIWEQDKELNRKYSYDFEVYGEKSRNEKDPEVEIYIATE